MTNETLADRVAAANARLSALRPAVEAGAPWAPSPHFGVEPEASWNPPELLAHVAEMLPYWLGQIDRILEGFPEPVSFGRVQSDDERIAAIGRDRALPIEELYRRIGLGADSVTARLRAMGPAELDRRGTHPTLGQMTVRAVVERMYIGHLNEHADQLERITGASPTGR